MGDQLMLEACDGDGEIPPEDSWLDDEDDDDDDFDDEDEDDDQDFEWEDVGDD
ncbi:MAG: hypothetical protein H0T51_07850 [Pirellulales bacterium]|nr:hypothetical protein [Pirellulales bacterium]